MWTTATRRRRRRRRRRNLPGRTCSDRSPPRPSSIRRPTGQQPASKRVYFLTKAEGGQTRPIATSAASAAPTTTDPVRPTTATLFRTTYSPAPATPATPQLNCVRTQISTNQPNKQTNKQTTSWEKERGSLDHNLFSHHLRIIPNIIIIIIISILNLNLPSTLTRKSKQTPPHRARTRWFNSGFKLFQAVSKSDLVVRSDRNCEIVVQGASQGFFLLLLSSRPTLSSCKI